MQEVSHKTQKIESQTSPGQAQALGQKSSDKNSEALEVEAQEGLLSASERIPTSVEDQAQNGLQTRPSDQTDFSEDFQERQAKQAGPKVRRGVDCPYLDSVSRQV